MKKFQIVGIGNAMVDILSRCEDSFLDKQGIQKGIMQLIDLERGASLYDAIGPSKEVSGGSAANTIAVIAELGGRTAYVGKVKDDQLGAIFAHDMRAQGAVYETPLAPASEAEETGRCIVLVTPDGERSMNTYLGVTEFLTPSDIDEAQMAEAEWIYLEGYRFDGPESHAAFAKAINATKAAGGKVSLTLSDPFCVERHRQAFRDMIAAHVDLLFCNRAELLSMYETDDFDAALAQGAADVEILACTDSANGAHIMAGGEHIHTKGEKVDIVDATGAGDAFAGAFLWSLAEGKSLENCGRAGNAVAASVISHIGPRPEANLTELLTSKGLI